MKIFFDHKIFSLQNQGGPSRYFVNLVSNLNKIKSINAKIFAPLHLNHMLSNLDRSNIGISNKIPFSNFFGKSNNLKKNLVKINNKINKYCEKKEKPDVIHTTYYDNNFPTKSNKLVVTVYDLIHEIFRDDYYKNDIFLSKKKILERANQIICISESTKKDLINFYNIDKKKITVTHLANSLSFDNELLDSEVFKDKKKFFLYVGSRWKYKNFNQLLYSLSYDKKIHKEFNLISFGGGKFSNDEIKLINKLNLDPHRIIQIDGDENLLKTLYRNAEFFIYPSKYEGFGIPTLESFSQGCPVLCSNTSSFPEVAGDAAIYFDPNSIESISKSIEKIINSAELRQKLIKRGNERLQKFSWTKCASETLDVYKKII
tara:strand:- start:820 stop:1938 length:1119 start_codon:yes stop_codon:yes gene_type:complete